MNTNLGMALNGKLGLLNYSVQSAVELFWEKRPNQKKEDKDSFTLHEGGANSDIQIFSAIENHINESNTNDSAIPIEENLERSIGQMMDQLWGNRVDTNRMAVMVESDLLKKWAKELEAFQNAPENLGPWKFDRYGLELEFSANVTTPSTVFVSVGSEFRVRLVWKKLPTTKEIEDKNQIAELISHLPAPEEFYKDADHGYRLKSLRLGLRVNAGGKIAIVDLSAQAGGYIWLIPGKKNKSNHKIDDHQFSGWERIVNRAFKKANKLVTKMEKREAKHKGKLGLKTIRLYFALNGGGSVGLVNVRGIPDVEIDFENKNWSQKSNKELAETGERLAGSGPRLPDQMRLRGRLRAGLGIPVIGRVEVRPFVEWHLKK